jgi:TRAP-type C4-dicarboxylate transport system substrate-binding protein
MYQVAVRDFAARIEKESGGSIKITIPDTTLAPSDRQYEMVRDGIADMAIVSSGAVPQLVVMNRLADLPFNSPKAQAASVALWETYNKYFAKFDELKGVKVLSTHVLPGRQIMSVGKVSISNAKDLAGVKLWSPPGALTQTVKALGAVPVNSEFTDLQEYVTKGNVDAVVITPGSAKGARILENVTGITNVPGGIGSLSFSVFISGERWSELTPDQQAAVLRAADGLASRTGQASDDADAKLKDIVSKIPSHVVEGDDLKSFEEILAARIDDWKKKAAAKGLENPDEVFAFYRSVLEREMNASGN